jgi:hypothetical protein
LSCRRDGGRQHTSSLRARWIRPLSVAASFGERSLTINEREREGGREVERIKKEWRRMRGGEREREREREGKGTFHERSSVGVVCGNDGVQLHLQCDEEGRVRQLLLERNPKVHLHSLDLGGPLPELECGISREEPLLIVHHRHGGITADGEELRWECDLFEIAIPPDDVEVIPLPPSLLVDHRAGNEEKAEGKTKRKQSNAMIRRNIGSIY